MQIYSIVIFILLAFNQGVLAGSFEQEFYRELAKAPARNFQELMYSTSKLSLIISRDFLDSQMDLRNARSTPYLQAFIDKTMERLYSTKQGLSFCAQHEILFQRQLGVSAETAKKILSRCLSMKMETGPLVGKEPKTYYFVTNVPANFPFHSWTSMTNETFIFLEDQLSEEEITARLIHEMAVQTDVKIMLGSNTVKEIAARYGYKIKNGLMNFGMDEAIRETVGGMPFPAMKFAGVALRAMVVESIMIEEIFGLAGFSKLKNQEVFSLLGSRQYEKALRLMAKAMLPIQDYLLPVEFLSARVEERRLLAEAMGEFYYLNEQLVDILVDNIANSKLSFISKSGSTSLLQWLFIPTVGTEGSFYSRGPRPRIGPGWAKYGSDKERVDILKNEKDYRIKKQGFAQKSQPSSSEKAVKK